MSKNNDCCRDEHPDHGQCIPGLNRVVGQLEGIKKMVCDRRHCPEILTQVRAARSALKTIESRILECHLQSCVQDSMKEGDLEAANKKIEELIEIFKRFD